MPDKIVAKISRSPKTFYYVDGSGNVRARPQKAMERAAKVGKKTRAKKRKARKSRR